MKNFADLVKPLMGDFLSLNLPQASIHYLLTDSRKLLIPAQTLFLAIGGERHNGHRFVQELYAKGVRNFVVEQTEGFDIAQMPEANVYRVSHTIKALQQIARNHRQQFRIPVLAITGSNGKTIVKEWLGQLLGHYYSVVKSPRSFNSQIGVPLSVWNMSTQHTFGVFEAGISQPGEMQNLQQVLQPELGIFTNIGTAHDEGFTSRTHKMAEKIKLFAGCRTLFYCRDQHELHQFISHTTQTWGETIAWSATQVADATYTIHINDVPHTFTLPFDDKASVENLLHCVAVMLYLQIEPDEIQTHLSALHNVAMRLELKQGINDCYLIDDSYNNDLAGLALALDFLDQKNQAAKDQKTVILSDVLESGMDEGVLYKQIARLLAEKNVKRLIGIGAKITAQSSLFGQETEFYPDTQTFLQNLNPQDFHNELILVKGARVFEFEKIVQRLQQKVHGTTLEINLDALVHNLNYYRSKLQPNTKIMVMVKAFGYGSGSYEVANLLQFHRADYIAVAYADEGVALRQHGITLPIMVMNPSPQTFDTLLEHKLEPELYSLHILEGFIHHLRINGKKARVHLKFDTGMHRLGFSAADMPKLASLLGQAPMLQVVSVFSHLAAADSCDHNDFTLAQIQQFETVAQQIAQVLGYQPLRHILNSAGIVRFPTYQFEMVRLGIGLYGVEVNCMEQAQLRTVSALKTTISQIKQVKAGETVGYSRKGVAQTDTTIATIAIGYADGFSRRFSGGVGRVKVNGQLAPVIGNVCMDMTMIDITGIEAQEGDEVIVFDHEHTISALAESIGTIPYEILTNVSERVKRVFFTA